MIMFKKIFFITLCMYTATNFTSDTALVYNALELASMLHQPKQSMTQGFTKAFRRFVKNFLVQPVEVRIKKIQNLLCLDDKGRVALRHTISTWDEVTYLLHQIPNEDVITLYSKDGAKQKSYTSENLFRIIQNKHS